MDALLFLLVGPDITCSVTNSTFTFNAHIPQIFKINHCTHLVMALYNTQTTQQNTLLTLTALCFERKSTAFNIGSPLLELYRYVNVEGLLCVMRIDKV